MNEHKIIPPCTHTHMFWARLISRCPKCGATQTLPMKEPQHGDK